MQMCVKQIKMIKIKQKLQAKNLQKKIKIKVKYELKKYFENIDINFNHKDLIKF